jgi:hypothetical protein
MKTLINVLHYLAEKDASSELMRAAQDAKDVLRRLVAWNDHMGGWEAGGALDSARRLLGGEAPAPLVYDKDHVCDNCERTWDDDELQQICDMWERVEPGGIMPSGQCPECGALCYPVKGGT